MSSSNRARRRRSSDDRPVARRQTRRKGNAALAVLIALSAIGLLAGGGIALSASTSEPPPDPAEQARAAVDDADLRARLAIERLAFEEAEQRLADERELAAHPLLIEQQAAIDEQIAAAEQLLACARAELAVLGHARSLQLRLQSAVCTPDLDGLEQTIDAFLSDPVATIGMDPALPVDIASACSLLDDADARLLQERRRRATGLVAPDWPTSEDTSVAARSARRQYVNAEKEVADCIADGDYARAFRYLQRCQAEYDQVSFAALWQQTTAALERDWPAIDQRIERAVSAAAGGGEQERQQARRLLLDTIPRLGDETYMARLRPHLSELGG